MKVKIGLMMAPALLLGLAAVGLLPGCEVGNPNDVVAGANGNFSGSYIGASGGLMVSGNSGAPVSSLTLSQMGNQLQAVDNNGGMFKGTVGDILYVGGNSSSNVNAAFTLQGVTSVGAAVTINGTLIGSGSTATMTGQWVEPDRFRGFYGVAGIAPISAGILISPGSATLNGVGSNQTFTASGGIPPYNWTLGNSSGELSPANPTPTVTYTRTSAETGDNTLTVTDGGGATTTVGIRQP
jgi:hypothetical protein